MKFDSSRRDYLVAGILFALCGTSGVGEASKFSSFLSIKNIPEEPVEVVCTVESKIFPDKIYQNVEEFWRDHQDPIAQRLNDSFSSKGLILNLETSMQSCGRIVLFKKIYKSQQAYDLYLKQWKFESFNRRFELDNLKFGIWPAPSLSNSKA